MMCELWELGMGAGGDLEVVGGLMEYIAVFTTDCEIMSCSWTTVPHDSPRLHRPHYAFPATLRMTRRPRTPIAAHQTRHQHTGNERRAQATAVIALGLE